MGLTIKNASSDLPALYLYGVIGEDMTADEFRQELATIPAKKAIELHIHSPGGSFFEAVAMHSQLRQRGGQVHTIADGIAASAGHLLLMSGDTITMSQHSSGMMHEAEVGRIERGRASDHRKIADLIDSVNDEIVSIYSKRWNGSEAELRSALDAETWFRAEEAVLMGLADSVSGAIAIAAKADDLKVFNYKNVPAEIFATRLPPKLAAAGEVLQRMFPPEIGAA